MNEFVENYFHRRISASGRGNSFFKIINWLKMFTISSVYLIFGKKSAEGFWSPSSNAQKGKNFFQVCQL
jgi:hypothetical protein